MTNENITTTQLPKPATVRCSDLLADSIRNENVEVHSINADNYGGPDPDPKTIWLHVGNQHFMLSGYWFDREEADWMAMMLSKALANLVRQSANTGGQR
jgi:hypothetical protein